MKLVVSGAAKFALRIRRPRWAGDGTSVMVNGKPEKIVMGTDGYMVVERNWKDKDVVEVRFPESFYTESIPDKISRVAVFYGPVLLAGELGVTEPDPVKGIPVLVAASPDPNQWVKRLGGDGLSFETSGVGQPADVKLIPFNRTANEYYSVYWDLFTPATWAAEQVRYAETRRKEQELEDRTIDRLRLGEMQPERDHFFTGDSLQSGEAHGRKWRAAENGGGFSFVMKVDASAGNSLLCSYWGDDHRGRIFDIQVDGQTIATQNLNSLKQSKFYEVSYAVPQELVKGKQSVTVKFVAHGPHSSVGPVSGTIKMIRN